MSPQYGVPKQPNFTASSKQVTLSIGDSFPLRIVGENINPFGRTTLNKELEKQELELVCEFARKQEVAGADALDINLGEIGEQSPGFYASAIKELQTVTNLPLFLDNSNPRALEQALRVYEGKAVINSVNGNREAFEILFPLAKQYGAGVILLGLDEKGIPEHATKRFRIIERLCSKALEFGLSKNDILADPLVLPVATSQNSFRETLNAIEMIKSSGIPTICGLSNFSFGLPQRSLLNTCFLSMAVERGLDAVIANPLDRNLTHVIKACDAITGRDKGMRSYSEIFKKNDFLSIQEFR